MNVLLFIIWNGLSDRLNKCAENNKNALTDEMGQWLGVGLFVLTFALRSEGTNVSWCVQVETQFARNQGLAHGGLIQLKKLGMSSDL